MAAAAASPPTATTDPATSPSAATAAPKPKPIVHNPVLLPRCSNCGKRDAKLVCPHAGDVQKREKYGPCPSRFCTTACRRSRRHSCIGDSEENRDYAGRKLNIDGGVVVTADGAGLFGLPGPVSAPVPHYLYDVRAGDVPPHVLEAIASDKFCRDEVCYVVRHCDFRRLFEPPTEGFDGLTPDQHKEMAAAIVAQQARVRQRVLEHRAQAAIVEAQHDRGVDY